MAAWQYRRGLLTLGRAVTLEVRGRRSGATVAVPLVVAELDGAEYLVSMLGDRANWVRNVRASGGEASLFHRGRRDVHLVEVPAEQRPPILARYLDLAPGARPHIPVSRRAPLSEFAAIAADYPVFRIEPGRAAQVS